MTRFRIAALTLVSATAVLLATLVVVRPVKGDDNQGGDESRIRQGIAAYPFPLNVNGKDRALVALGSYFVNVAGDCNGCHTSDQANPYLPGGNPFLGQPQRIDPTKYLVGGTVFI